jgi:hypothetical protein
MKQIQRRMLQKTTKTRTLTTPMMLVILETQTPDRQCFIHYENYSISGYRKS